MRLSLTDPSSETSADSSEIGANSDLETQLKLFGNRKELIIKWSLQQVVALGAGACPRARGVGTKIRRLLTGCDLANATRSLDGSSHR